MPCSLKSSSDWPANGLIYRGVPGHLRVGMGGKRDWILQSSSRKPVKFDEKTGLDRLKNRLKTEKPATSAGFMVKFADRTGLEPATSAVTGRHSNQLNYRSKFIL